MSDDNKPKIGAGHVSAMFRQGLAELRGALYPESNVAQPPQYGIYGTKTPGEVMQEKQAEGRDPDEQPSVLEERMKPQAQERDSQERQRPGMERE
jgi:hypothetical protein